MTPDEVSSGLTWLSERFVLIRYEDEELPSIDWVLDTARAAVMRCVRRCFLGGLFGDPLHFSAHTLCASHLARRDAGSVCDVRCTTPCTGE